MRAEQGGSQPRLPYLGAFASEGIRREMENREAVNRTGAVGLYYQEAISTLREGEEDVYYNQHLCRQLDASHAMQDSFYAEVDDHLAHLSFHAEPLAMTEQEEEEMKKEAEEHMFRMQGTANSLQEKERVLASIQETVSAIYCTLSSIHLPPGQHSSLLGELTKDTQMIWSKMEKLRAHFLPCDTVKDPHEGLELQNFKALQLPEDNVRVSVRPLSFRRLRDRLRHDIRAMQAASMSGQQFQTDQWHFTTPKERNTSRDNQKDARSESGPGRK